MSTSFRQSASEFASSMGAGTAGAIAFSLLSDSGTLGKALSIPVALAAGGVTKFGIKAGLQDALLDAKDRTVSGSDLLWGSVDGLAGITASMADQRVSQSLLQSMGRKELGANISDEMAQTAARQIIKDSPLQAIKYNATRGVVGGAVGSFTWSVPHRTFQNAGTLESDPLQGGLAVIKGVATDTAFGAAAGGIMGGALTSLHRSPEIIGKTVAGVRGNGGLLQVDEHSINDLHSNVDMLPRLMTKQQELAATAAAKSIPLQTNVAGDLLSGHVNFAYTADGAVENQAVIKMGFQNIIPGNHEYDAAGGGVDVDRYVKVMAPILKENPQVSLLNANLDVSAYPEYQDIVKPYVVRTVAGPAGPEKIATVGLITDEGAVGKIGYNDAAQTAVNTVRDLNSQGIKNIVLLTHLGLENDQKLAKTLLDNDLVVAKITGGHSHDVTARPIWISNKQSLADRLQFWKPTRSIPITQAGSSGEFMSESHIAFNADGSANRWLTTGRLHPLRDVAPNLGLQSDLTEQTRALQALKSTTYGAGTRAPYSLDGMRNGETPLGNLVADSNLYGLQKQLGAEEGPQIALVQAGILKSGLDGSDLSRRDLANIFINAGKVENEQQELAMSQMSGRQIKAALEYGLRDHPAVSKPPLSTRLQDLVTDNKASKPDLPGNFLQVSGLKYTFDNSQSPWARVSNLQVRTGDGGFVPLEDNQTYRVVTRGHAIGKWNGSDGFGTTPISSSSELPDEVAGQPLRVSQVDLLADFIKGRQLNPAVDSAPDGRIVDATPQYGNYAAKPSLSSAGFAYDASRDADPNKQR